MSPAVCKQAMVTAILLLGAAAQSARADRIKDLVEVRGARPNSLVGVGIVTGLDGTGDDANSPAVRRTLGEMMKKLGITLDEIQLKQLKARNAALVTVSAVLPPFARAGATIDVVVSSAGTARSLVGGTLVLTPLKGPDLVTYALAQGSLSSGAFTFQGATGTKVAKNHPTVARIPGGARVEKDAPGTRLVRNGEVMLFLRAPDFTTATRVAEAINAAQGEGSARVTDPGAVAVKVPAERSERVVELISSVEGLTVVPDVGARVVINERTGTIVVGANVTLGPATVAHGGITVRVSEERTPSQPNVLARAGETVVTPRTGVDVEEGAGGLVQIPAATTAGSVANALNALGVKPRDLVTIFQALAQAGALSAEIIVQ
ncbi:MAG: flagellar basal body P-ring protein FlgI [Pseudomonadota bacterium]